MNFAITTIVKVMIISKLHLHKFLSFFKINNVRCAAKCTLIECYYISDHRDNIFAINTAIYLSQLKTDLRRKFCV